MRDRRWHRLSWALVLLVSALAFGTAQAEPEAIWLEAADGVAVRADFYALPHDRLESIKQAPFVLLFHQAGSNRGEYATIGPRLNRLGFNALALDQRSGADGWGVENETVKKLGESTSYLESMPDLEAALAWKKASGYTGPTVIWGSSYSAAMVFLLAGKHPEIAGVLSFSPGEYLATRKDEVSKAAAAVYQPVLVLTPEDERERAQGVVDAIASDDKLFVVPEQAVHGSSMLVESKNAGAAEVWLEVEQFLKRFH